MSALHSELLSPPKSSLCSPTWYQVQNATSTVQYSTVYSHTFLSQPERRVYLASYFAVVFWKPGYQTKLMELDASRGNSIHWTFSRNQSFIRLLWGKSSRIICIFVRFTARCGTPFFVQVKTNVLAVLANPTGESLEDGWERKQN